MVDLKPAKRYAKALFNLAIERDLLEEIWEDLCSLCALLEKSPELSSLLLSPLLDVEKKSSLLNALLKDKINSLTYQFILFLDDKKRIKLLLPCGTAFDELYYEYNGIIKVNIISAVSLHKEQIASIETILKDKFSKEIESHLSVDSSILGGFKLIIGDKVIDLSLLSQLNKVKQNIINS